MAYNRLAKFKACGRADLLDRSSRHRNHPRRVEAAIAAKVTKPYRSQTNGKAERLIQTALREWAYRLAEQSSEDRTQALKVWLHHDNRHRSHSAHFGRKRQACRPIPCSDLAPKPCHHTSRLAHKPFPSPLLGPKEEGFIRLHNHLQMSCLERLHTLQKPM